MKYLISYSIYSLQVGEQISDLEEDNDLAEFEEDESSDEEHADEEHAMKSMRLSPEPAGKFISVLLHRQLTGT